MAHRPSKFRLKLFYGYLQRVFGFQQLVQSIHDFRQDNDIPTASLFEALVLGFVLHLGSFRALEFEMKQGRVRKVLKRRVDFHINTLRYATEQFELETLDQALVRLSRTMKRAKMLQDTIDGFHVAALDGTEFFRSEAIQCDECMVVHVDKKVNDEQGNSTQLQVQQSVHRAVMLQHVGGRLKPFLAAEPIRPKDKQPGDEEPGHEGELTAAKRLLVRLKQLYGTRFIDILTLDALYMNYPFVRHCRNLGYHLIARVKDERTHLYREIEALAPWVQPIRGYDPHQGIAYELYYVPGISIASDWDIPLDGFKIVETKENGQTQTFRCATTAVPDVLPVQPDTLRRIVHLKWGIENNGNRDLKSNWHLEHNFHHHPVATWAIVMTLLISYNLFYAYVYRQMKTYRIYGLTQQQIIDEFRYSFYALRYWLPWSVWTKGP